MNKFLKIIEDYKKSNKERNSVSNLIKKIRLDTEFYFFIDTYLTFGTLKQKLYHIINDLPKSKLICSVCNESELNWIDDKNLYSTTCSRKCSGKLSGKKKNPKREPHPILNSKGEFINYFNKNKIKLVESSLYKVYPELVTSINNTIKIESDNFSEKVYLYLNDMESSPFCNHCDINKVSFDTFRNGYHKYCSVKCSSNSNEKKNKIKETCITKYGVENIGSITREKANTTMNLKYGMNFSKTSEFKHKYKNTSLEKYGVEHTFKSESIKKKIRRSNEEKYGSDNPMKNKEVLEKSLNTKKEKGIIYKWTEDEMKDIQSYRRSVSYYTEKTYEEYKNLLNPEDLPRGIHDNHIDHIFPVIEGWRNKIDPKLISNYKNLKLVSSYENLSKGERTDMTIDEFYKTINE
jgi:hypothetical protein